MLKATTLILAAITVASVAKAEPKKDRPVGDDKTDSAPLDQTPRPLPEDHQVAPGSADQGGGSGGAGKADK